MIFSRQQFAKMAQPGVIEKALAKHHERDRALLTALMEGRGWRGHGICRKRVHDITVRFGMVMLGHLPPGTGPRPPKPTPPPPPATAPPAPAPQEDSVGYCPNPSATRIAALYRIPHVPARVASYLNPKFRNIWNEANPPLE